MNKTGIDWVKNPDGSPGYTWNPITGCLNGCLYCYARKLATTRLRERYLKNPNIANQPHDMNDPLWDKVTTDPFYPRFWPERLTRVSPDQKPRGIFACDMSDLFGKGIPDYWTQSVLWHIDNCPQHRFYLLTKQPQNLPQWSPFPDNCWVGVTACNRDMFNNAIWYLKDIVAKVRFISFEPLLGETIAGILDNRHDWPVMNGSILGHTLDWLIIGAQTRPTVYPKIEWVEEIVEAANCAGIPIFIKDNLKSYLDTIPTRIVYQYGSGKLRQEMPE